MEGIGYHSAFPILNFGCPGPEILLAPETLQGWKMSFRIFLKQKFGKKKELATFPHK